MMRVLLEVASDPIASIPWPAQLTLSGALIVTIVAILRWQNQQVQKGNLIPKVEHDRALAQKDTEYVRMEKILTERIAAEHGVGQEWREAHGVSEKAREVERETTKDAVQSNRLLDSFMDQFTAQVAPRSGASRGSTPVTDPGDTSRQEVTP